MSRAIAGTRTRVAEMKAARTEDAGTRAAKTEAAVMKAVTRETGVVAEAGDARTEIGAQPFSLLEYRVTIGRTVSCPPGHADSGTRRGLPPNDLNLLAGSQFAYPLFFCDR